MNETKERFKMPNYCDYQMKLRGAKENVQKFIAYLKADYSYNNGKWECSEDRHFFRVFEAAHDPGEDTVDVSGETISTVGGYCAWSVFSCLFEGNHTYYDQWKNDGENFKGTHILEASKELDLDIEIYSEEAGVGFMEHYLIEKGELLVDDCFDDFREIEDEDGEWIKTGGVEWTFSF